MKGKVLALLITCLCFVGSPVYTDTGESVNVKGIIECKNSEVWREYTYEVSYDEEGEIAVSNGTNLKEGKSLADNPVGSGTMSADVNMIKCVDRVISVLLCLIVLVVLVIVFVVLPIINIYKYVVKSKEYKTLQEEYDRMNCEKGGNGSGGLQ